MLWQYILKIKLNDEIVYLRDIEHIEDRMLDEEKSLLDKNTIDCEILSNMKVNNNAR